MSHSSHRHLPCENRGFIVVLLNSWPNMSACEMVMWSPSQTGGFPPGTPVPSHTKTTGTLTSVLTSMINIRCITCFVIVVKYIKFNLIYDLTSSPNTQRYYEKLTLHWYNSIIDTHTETVRWVCCRSPIRLYLKTILWLTISFHHTVPGDLLKEY